MTCGRWAPRSTIAPQACFASTPPRGRSLRSARCRRAGRSTRSADSRRLAIGCSCYLHHGRTRRTRRRRLHHHAEPESTHTHHDSSLTRRARHSNTARHRLLLLHATRRRHRPDRRQRRPPRCVRHVPEFFTENFGDQQVGSEVFGVRSTATPPRPITSSPFRGTDRRHPNRRHRADRSLLAPHSHELLRTHRPRRAGLPDMIATCDATRTASAQSQIEITASGSLRTSEDLMQNPGRFRTGVAPLHVQRDTNTRLASTLWPSGY